MKCLTYQSVVGEEVEAHDRSLNIKVVDLGSFFLTVFGS